MWRKGSEGAFSVKSCYDHVVGGGEVLGHWKAIWYTTVSFKVQFFMWTATLDKISTMNMLQRKGMCFPSVCIFCYQEAKSTSHLLIHCCFSWEIWCAIARDFSVDFIAPSILSGLLQAWRIPAFTSIGIRIWWERNNRVFRSYSKPSYQVHRRVKKSIIFGLGALKDMTVFPMEPL